MRISAKYNCSIKQHLRTFLKSDMFFLIQYLKDIFDFSKIIKEGVRKEIIGC